MTIEGSSGAYYHPIEENCSDDKKDMFRRFNKDNGFIDCSVKSTGPTWADMQALRKNIEEDNKSGVLEIESTPEKIGKYISDLCDEITKLKTALKFYADEENYHCQNDEYYPAIEADQGDTAREALK